MKLIKNDTFYLFSDGFPDQFGGPEGKKYKYKPFKEFLISIQEKELKVQGELIQKEFEDWRGEHEQIDDVIVMGIKI